MARKKEYTEYAQPFLADIVKWKEVGLTDADIHKKLRIGKTLACKWKNKHKDFREAFKKGETELVIDLKHTLYHRAKGYYVENVETYIEEYEGKVKKKVHKKRRFIWSDKCMEMALCHLEPGKWSTKQEYKEGQDKQVIIVDDLE